MAISGRPLINSLELLLETNTFQSLNMDYKTMMDIVFTPWTGADIDLTQELFPESDFGWILMETYCPELLDRPSEEIGVDWDEKVVKPFLRDYKITIA